MSSVKIALIGAGQRGTDVYGQYALQHPHKLQYVAVAEPVAERRQRLNTSHDIAPDMQFASWEQLLEQPKLADAVIVATPDNDHIAPAITAMEAGYDVLLEKPMATTAADCAALVRASEKHGRILQISHVLRYSEFFSTLHDIVRSGRLGDVITVEHRENVTYWHMAHSFVRGNWNRAENSNPMILAKCCHDLDLLYWILGEKIAWLSSVGSLRHYKPENAPHPDVPERCTDGCPVADECPFYAPAIYIEHRPWRDLESEQGRLDRVDFSSQIPWILSTVANGNLNRDAIQKALEEGPYGRCVYHCDNDVVDHQVVMMETEAGTSVTLIMHGHSHEEGRTMRWDGTRATLEGKLHFSGAEIRIHDHLTGKTEIINPVTKRSWHGGGDEKLIESFISAVQRQEQAPLTDARASLESHLMAFAAEEARLNRTIIDMNAYRQQVLGE
jgi:predicted dehydrogenase